jgi:dTDP-L-rhamnose 4-epimerase
MKVLVTGGAGFIGSHTVDALLARGYEVRVLDRLGPPTHTGAWPSYLSADAERVHGDVTDRDALHGALRGVDAVFHLAAYQDYLTDFSHFFLTNSVSTALLYELIIAERLPIRKVVVASSQAVYGEGKYSCTSHGSQFPDQRGQEQLERGDWEVRCSTCTASIDPTWTDETVTRPHNSYAFSKRDQEDIAIKLGRRYAIPSVALRYSIVLGPRQSFRNTYSGALRSFTVRALHDQPPVLYEDGGQLRDYVAINDVVRANLLVFEDPRADFGVFNVGGDRRVTVRELADRVVEAAAAQVEPEVAGLYRVGDTRHVFSDISQLKALGWRPRVSLDEIVGRYVAWAADQPDLRDTFAHACQRMQATGVVRRAVKTRGAA